MAAEQLRVLEPRRREPAGVLSRLRRLSRRVRRITLLLAFLLFACLLFPREPSFEVTTLREGYPAKRDLIAPFQFYLLKDRALLRHEQTIGARAVAPIYSADAASAQGTENLLDSLRAAETAPGGRGHGRLQELGLSPEAARVVTGPDGKRVLLLARRIA